MHLMMVGNFLRWLMGCCVCFIMEEYVCQWSVVIGGQWSVVVSGDRIVNKPLTSGCSDIFEW